MKKTSLKIIATIGFALVILVNYLANALPIGGVTTGEASDSYANLFTPTGFTFSIWGLIYLLLAIYTVYQYGKAKTEKKEREKVIARVNKCFIVSSIANISWIFAWHYGMIWLSVLIMLVLLGSLIKIAGILRQEKFSTSEKICIRLPFSVYFGWITVATIANVTVFLVNINWNGFGLADSLWTVIILLVGAIIGIWRMQKDQNIPYGLVFVWAYFGIMYKHISPTGFDNQYPCVVITVVFCLMLLLGSTVVISQQKKKMGKVRKK